MEKKITRITRFGKEPNWNQSTKLMKSKMGSIKKKQNICGGLQIFKNEEKKGKINVI